MTEEQLAKWNAVDARIVRDITDARCFTVIPNPKHDDWVEIYEDWGSVRLRYSEPLNHWFCEEWSFI